MPTTATSTTSRLPTELWSRIFTFSVEDGLGTLPALLAVNHTFNSIANRTPQLWMRLFFGVKDGGVDTACTQALLRKSGVLPLNIRILMLTHDAEDARTLAELLREAVVRFKALDLIVPSYGVAEDVLAWTAEHQPAPLLERLHIFYNTGGDQPYGDELFLWNEFCPAPRLTHISLPADPLPSADSLPLFAEAKTIILETNICVYRCDIHDVVDFLCKLPLLEHISFKGVDGQVGILWPLDDHHEYVPRLLSVNVTVPGHGLEILHHLDAPSLTYIRLDGRRPFRLQWNRYMSTSLADAFLDLSHRSPLVTRLELVSIQLLGRTTEYEWIFSGEAFPALESLRLEAMDITDVVLQACGPPRSGLKRLELWACEGITGAGLTHFVQGCGEGFELLLDSCPNVSQEIIATLSRTIKVETECHAFNEYNDDGCPYAPPLKSK